MLTALILVVVLVVLLASTTAIVVTRRRHRGPELEPPPRRPSGPVATAGAPPAVDQQVTEAPGADQVTEAPGADQVTEGTLTADQLAEIEEALRRAEGPPAAPPAAAPEAPPAPPLEPVPEPEPEAVAPPLKPRFRDRLGKARSLLAGYMGSVRSRGKINEETWEELEEALIRADVGVETTTALLDDLRAQVKRTGISDPEDLLSALKTDIVAAARGGPCSSTSSSVSRTCGCSSA